jgi:divinyl protochlorophyllide a 8-vinyl-reductase
MSQAVLSPAGPAMARIGPNTIIQVVSVLRDRRSPAFAEDLLRDATPYSMESLPTEMVDEREAQAVVRTLVSRIGAVHAAPVLREAGYRTAEYLMAHRIPAFAQLLIRLLPRRLGLQVLLQAMLKNAWTFAGSGHFRIVPTRGAPELVFDGCAMCRDMHEAEPMCDFYAGTFERLIAALVAPAVRVTEVECIAQGGQTCRFELAHV